MKHICILMGVKLNTHSFTAMDLYLLTFKLTHLYKGKTMFKYVCGPPGRLQFQCKWEVFCYIPPARYRTAYWYRDVRGHACSPSGNS